MSSHPSGGGFLLLRILGILYIWMYSEIINNNKIVPNKQPLNHQVLKRTSWLPPFSLATNTRIR